MKKARAVGRMSDEAVKKATGKAWAEWFKILDADGMKGKSHREIVACVHRTHGVGPWWQQMVSVEYERARGMRAVHETPSGFSASISKTIAASADDLFEAWSTEARRAKWLRDAKLTVRKATAPKSMRITWGDHKTNVEVQFYSKGASKATVTVEHGKLANAKEVQRKKAYWTAALEKLKTHIE